MEFMLLGPRNPNLKVNLGGEPLPAVGKLFG